MKEADREEMEGDAVPGGMVGGETDGQRTRMGYGKIPVWVYTAKNGYAWQGLEEGEDRATAAALDKALAAAGRVGGAWGAVVRRPVASRRWAEWPRSRLCWVLFRFFPGAGRDQRGRNCNYTAAACIPAEDGRPKLDFGKLFSAPAMSQVGSEGLDRLWIDLDGDEDYLLRGPLLRLRREENAAEPSWERSWDAPELLREDALRTLSRWCQGKGVDAGDLKAVARTGEDGAGTLVVHATYAVYPQVAAALAAEDEWRAARPEGGAEARQALEKWRGALGALGDLNRALGGLEGLSSLLEDRHRALEEAEGAAMDAEQSARMAAAAAASAEAATEAIGRGLARFRMARDPERGKGDNRRKLDELGRAIEEGRRKHGPGARWTLLERDLDELRRRVAQVEGCLDTVCAFQKAALAGAGGASAALDREAREAIAQARGLGRWGSGTFALDALSEMERMYRIGHAQSGGRAGANAAPVTFGGGSENAGGEDTGRHGHRRKHGEGAKRPWWRQWWWWPAVGTVAVAALLAVPWWMGRKSELKKWEGIRKAACGQAREFRYSEALKKLDEIKPKWFFCLGTNRYAAELRKPWNTLAALQTGLQNAVNGEKEARRALDEAEKEKAANEGNKALAETEWTAYEDAKTAARDLLDALRMDEAGIPAGIGEKDWPELPNRYSRAANQWRLAAANLDEACRIIHNTLNPSEKEQKQTLLASHRKELDEARQAAENAKGLLSELQNKKLATLGIGRHYADREWEEYENCAQQAEDLVGNVGYDEEGWPFRNTAEGMQPLELKAEQLAKLADDYRSAREAWSKAFDAFEDACKNIETALGEDREKLRTACKQAQEAKKRLSELKNDNKRYEAARNSRKTREAWTQYVQLINTANGILKELPGIKDGLPFPAPITLEKGQLADLCGKMNNVGTLRAKAYDQLEKAYRILDKERADAELRAAMQEKAAADAGETTVEGNTGGGGDFFCDDVENVVEDDVNASNDAGWEVGSHSTREGTETSEAAQVVHDGVNDPSQAAGSSGGSGNKEKGWKRYLPWNWGRQDSDTAAAPSAKPVGDAAEEAGP